MRHLYVKHQRTSQSGVPSLKDKGLLVSENTEKAEVLSRQFISAHSEGTTYRPTGEEMTQKCTLEGKRDDFLTLPLFKITTAKKQSRKTTSFTGMSWRMLSPQDTSGSPFKLTANGMSTLRPSLRREIGCFVSSGGTSRLAQNLSKSKPT